MGRDESLSLFSVVSATYTLECMHLELIYVEDGWGVEHGAHVLPQIQQIWLEQFPQNTYWMLVGQEPPKGQEHLHITE